MTSLFCRHNRFTADCPICSKGTVLDPARQSARPAAPRSSTPRPSRGGGRRQAPPGAVARTVTGPYASAGPYAGEDGGRYEVRLERVPGGVRLASWSGGALARRAPELAALDLARLVAQARERNILQERDIEPIERALAVEPADGAAAEHGASAGRAGDLREELRVEPVADGRLRVARWIYRPNRGWELQDAPVMLPAKRIAEALRDAARGGVLARAGGQATRSAMPGYATTSPEESYSSSHSNPNAGAA